MFAGRPPPPTAALSTGPKVVKFEDQRLEAGEALAVERLTRKRKLGRRPHQGLMILCAGPHRYGSEDAWDYEKEMEWARACLRFIKKMIGDKSIVVNASLHRDETSPHLHVLVVPRDSHGVLAWKRRKREVHGSVFGLSQAESKAVLRTPNIEYCALQDVFWRECGQPFGLLRGVSAAETRAKRSAPDREKADQYRTEEAERNAEQTPASRPARTARSWSPRPRSGPKPPTTRTSTSERPNEKRRRRRRPRPSKPEGAR